MKCWILTTKMLSDLDLLNSAVENLKWFHDNFSELQEKYENKIIAIKDKKIIISADNVDKLLAILKNKGIDDSEVLIESIHPKDELIIL